MNVTKASFTQLTHMVTAFLKDDLAELEMKYANTISRQQFSRLITALRNQRGLREVHHPESLDVFIKHDGQSIRMTIEGKHNIQEYCESNKVNPSHVRQILSKQLVNGMKPLVLDGTPLKFDIKREITVAASDELLQAFDSSKKGFRFKKRFSFSTSTHRFDLTVVKSSGKGATFVAHNSFAASGTLDHPESYEIELELIHGRANQAVDVPYLAQRFLKVAFQTHATLTGVDVVTSKKDHDAALSSYLRLVKLKRDDEALRDKPRTFFVGPQPVTLELQNVAQDGVPDATILQGYTVTEKADGERCLLFINGGKCWLVNGKMEFMHTGVELGSDSLQQCIIDGEWVTQDAMGAPTKIFAMFDAYYIYGKDVRALPLVGASPCRVDHMSSIEKTCKAAFQKHGITLFAKHFHTDASIFAASRRVLDMVRAKQYPYRIDGLIFTPSKMSVGGMYEGDVSALGSMGGTWTKAFKWKPPHENTIDFGVRLLEDKKVATDPKGKPCHVYKLFVGYKAASWEPIRPMDVLKGEWVRPSDTYGLKLFSPNDVVSGEPGMFYGEPDANGVVRCKNGDIIENGSIVEFAYTNDTTLDFPMRWVPLRVRKDKTTPNDFATAMNVWRSIGYPVTEAIIQGDENVMTDEIPEVEVYYKRIISRDRFSSKNMSDFHNQGVKKRLIESYCAKAHSLLDIACGKAGDLNKWLATSLKEVYGIDKVRDNIENPVDGAYARVLRMKDQDEASMRDRNFVFGTFDGSVQLTNENVQALQDPNDAFVARKVIEHGAFDVVSCQFALHYFFANESSLDNFVFNVASFLKPGAYFVATCLNGAKVAETLGSNDKVVGVSQVDGRIIWQIKRVPESKNAIKVYMESIGIEMKEYLVDVSALEAKFKRYGVVPVAIKSFEDIYAEILDSYKTSRRSPYFVKSMREMSDVEKQYSFMNMTLVFQKTGEHTTDIPKPKKTVRTLKAKAPPAPPVEKVVVEPEPPKATNAVPMEPPKEQPTAPVKKKVVVKKKST